MREKDFRQRVVTLLRPVMGFSVENAVGVGMPDVCCTLGWLELKVAETPARIESSRVCIDLRNEQRIWLRRWRMHGGRAWTLVMMKDTDIVLLHDGHWSADNLGHATMMSMTQCAIGVWDGIPTSGELIERLIRKLPDPVISSRGGQS